MSVPINEFLKAITEKDYAKAVAAIKRTNLLPAVCGRVCPQEEQCVKNCVLTKKQDAVAIGRLERFVADWEATRAPRRCRRSRRRPARRSRSAARAPAG